MCAANRHHCWGQCWGREGHRMARATNRLSARTVASLLKKPGRHSDGGGLYLSVSADGSRRRWVFLFRWKEPGEKGAGKLKEMGLGSAGTVSLARARERAAQARAQLADKQNPLKGRKAEARTPTFGEVADAVLASLEASVVTVSEPTTHAGIAEHQGNLQS